MITSFDDWKEENLVLDDDGMVCVLTRRLSKNPAREDGMWLSNPCFDDFEDLWDFWQERSDIKMKLIMELDELLENPIQMHFDFSKEDQSDEANLFRDNLHRIKKIMKALKV